MVAVMDMFDNEQQQEDWLQSLFGNGGVSNNGGGGTQDPPPNSTVYYQDIANANANQQSSSGNILRTTSPVEQEAVFDPFANSSWWNHIWSDAFNNPTAAPSAYDLVNGTSGYGSPWGHGYYVSATQNPTVYSPGYDTSPTILADGVAPVPASGSVWWQSPSQGYSQDPYYANGHEQYIGRAGDEYGINLPITIGNPSVVYEHPPNNAYQQWLDWENRGIADTPYFVLDENGDPAGRYVWNGETTVIQPLPDTDLLMDSFHKIQQDAAASKREREEEFANNLQFLEETGLNHFVDMQGYQGLGEANPQHPLITGTSQMPELDLPFYDQNGLDYFTSTSGYQDWQTDWYAENPQPNTQPPYDPTNPNSPVMDGQWQTTSAHTSNSENPTGIYMQQNNNVPDFLLEPPTTPVAPAMQPLIPSWMGYPTTPSRTRSTQSTANWVASMINWKL